MFVIWVGNPVFTVPVPVLFYEKYRQQQMKKTAKENFTI
jgi:hypothetical protein